MKIGIIGTRGWGSLEWYATELCEGLRKEGIDAEMVWYPQPSWRGGQTVHHALLLPRYLIKIADRFDVLHATQPGFSTVFPLLSRVGKVVTFHDLVPLTHPGEFSRSYISRALNFSAFFFWIQTSRFAHTVVVDSSLTWAEMVQVGYPREKLEIVNLWVRSTIRRVPVRKNGKILGYVGAVTHRKNVEYVVETFDEFQKLEKNSQLWICGSGSDIDYLEKIRGLVKKKGLAEKVKFWGPVDEKKLSWIYSSLDVFITGTRAEGFGLPILEAQKCGVPVLVRKDARIPEEVKKCAIPVASPKDAAQKAWELIHNPSLRSRVVRDGLKHASKFSLERAVRKMMDIYENIMEETK